MDQETIRTNLHTLERKVMLLVSEHKRSKEEITTLKDENTQLKSLIEAKNEQIRNFQNKINISKLVNRTAVMDDNTAELKKMIDGYLKEIDKCIAHISR